MTRPPLTTKQARVYEAICLSWAKHGYGPSYRDLMTALGVQSQNTITCHLASLERKGWIVRERSISRSIRPVSSQREVLVAACRTFVDSSPHFQQQTTRQARAYADLREALEAVEGKGKAA